MATASNLKVLDLLAAKQRSASATGGDVDLKGYINPGGRQMKAYISVGAATGTGETLAVKIQEADDTSSYTDITGAAFTSVGTNATTEEIHFRTNKRYVRAIATLGGTSPVYDFGVHLLVEKRLT